jgi:hypothetical protein
VLVLVKFFVGGFSGVIERRADTLRDDADVAGDVLGAGGSSRSWTTTPTSDDRLLSFLTKLCVSSRFLTMPRGVGRAHGVGSDLDFPAALPLRDHVPRRAECVG